MSAQNILRLFWFFMIIVFSVKEADLTKEFSGKEALDRINFFRKVHNDESLSNDFILQRKALSLVTKAAKNKGFGDEISAGVNTYQVCATYGVAITAKQVIDAWYNEVCQDKVNFEIGGFENAESFSQLVWRDTGKVGIATKKGSKDNQTCQYIAAVFRPPGNIEGFYTDNIQRGKFSQKYCDDL